MLRETAATPAFEAIPEADCDESRRQFINHAGRGLLAVSVAGTLPVAAAKAQAAASAAQAPATGPTDVKLPPLNAPTEPQSAGPPNPDPVDQRVGFALVGLGHLTLEELLPAFAHCKHAKPVALVSGDADKMGKIARQYGIKPSSCYSYQTYDQLKNNPEVEVIYIVLPNSMHAEFTVRGAQAGKHILCEKPMANSVKECEEMIAACKKAGKKLMIAYRIQYEPLNRMAQKMVRDKTYGPTKLIEMVNTQNQAHDNQWRHKKALAGGGALPDIGLYCLNTTRFLLGEEPTEVSASIYSTPGDARFKEVEENVSFRLRFPSGVMASCVTGYGSFNSKAYTVHAETGSIRMDPAFTYHGLHQERVHAPGGKELKETPGGDEKNQFALEMDHMAECVRQNKTPYTPGEEGLQDQRIMEAIYQSAKENKPVKLDNVRKIDAFRGTPPTDEA
ncbi:Gfo/Idh/MocA family oxidoreductase [Hymenobacter sp. BT770]|uniref:Gfo/Idh/MocA family protein n=1 Tax=Hymenobacter sp. BT770 TaxID=2886942 RepID=UPI001D0FB407|nr:Gfo/Idh/MocA family oxidoreductase [Hymenobacter sp. BT770]MCC3154200.1 Gfo/Idh/MocA family oxidoreductase [Hymenobacter sp. BT770]MDO3414353.1 Gfo/Idh/MocA family oxidoreductase [Hymenobacter sp. BT770]